MSKTLTSSQLPQKVQIAMVKKELTVSDIASKLRKSKSTISLVLRGKLRARETANRIARILGINVSDFTSEGERYSRQRRKADSKEPSLEKGSKDALIYALSSPSRCTYEDVSSLLNTISSGSMKPSYAKLFRGQKGE